MHWYVYILLCGDGTLYTGITDNLNQRLKAHNEGSGAKYTRGRGPHAFAYVETCANRSEALKKEAAIKRMTRAKKWTMIEQHMGKQE
jgi:predicted GIY-YIG superfamily endonuclease